MVQSLARVQVQSYGVTLEMFPLQDIKTRNFLPISITAKPNSFQVLLMKYDSGIPLGHKARLMIIKIKAITITEPITTGISN